MLDLTRTIVAISTPAGCGATATLRISGQDAITVADRMFTAASGSSLTDTPSNKMVFGKIMLSEAQMLDEVMAVAFRTPHSYTGEDSVEIYCHGSVYIQQSLLELSLTHGAFLAAPGEFTERAYLNGKMDLSQAEAVGDLIAAQNRLMHKTAITQMRGGYSEEIRHLRQELLQLTALLELELDFSEEEVEFADRNNLQNLLTQILQLIDGLASSFRVGNAVKNGVAVAIVGRPNVGKSTLLNALLKEERAIVSSIAGTTRDSIEETITLGGIMFRFIDTAGIRETTDEIESIGVERARQKIKQAQLVIVLIAGADGKHYDVAEFDEWAQEIPTDTARLYVVNKMDEVFFNENERPNQHGKTHVSQQTSPLLISAKQGLGIDQLIHQIVQLAAIPEIGQNDIIVTNVRHYDALVKTSTALQNCLAGMQNHIPGDLLAMDIREAIRHLGSITGEITPDEVLQTIFGQFCIGK